MTVYESLFILRASLTEEAVTSILDKMKAALVQHGAVVLQAESWGKKKLAYAMKHDQRGIYMLLRFESAHGNVVSELERLYRLEDSVMKFLTVKADAIASAPEAGDTAVAGKAESADGGV